MNIVLYLLLLSFNVGLVRLTLSVSIQNPLRVSENVNKNFGKVVRKTRWDHTGELSSRNSRDSQYPEVSPLLENKLEERQEQHGLQTESQLGEANPVPTFHKHKLKHKIHSHGHIHTHGDIHTGHLFPNPAIPSVNQHWHQNQEFINTGYIDKNVDVSNPSFGGFNQQYGSYKPGSLSHGSLQQNTNLIANQNIHLNNHLINNQNTHLISNQNIHSINNQNTHSINNQNTQSINNQNTHSINNQNTQSINNQNTLLINNQNPHSINNQNTHSINNQNTQSINNQNTFLINNQNPHSINNQNTHSINNQNTQSINNQNTLLINNQNPHSINNQNTHSINNQNTHLINNQNSHLINNQNGHLINQNNNFGNEHISNGFTNGANRNEALNFQSGHLNAPSQFTNQQIYPRETDSIHFDDVIRQTGLGHFQDDNEQTSFRLRSQEGPSSENTRSAIYDSEMDSILNVLDARSYKLVRPTMKPHLPHQKNYIGEVEHSEKSFKEPLECTYVWHEPEAAQKLNYEDGESGDVNVDYSGNSRQYDNVRLQSPHIIQIPYNSNFQSHRWGYIRNTRSSEKTNSTRNLQMDASLLSNRTIGNSNTDTNFETMLRKSSENSTLESLPIKAMSYNVSKHFENMNDTLKDYRNMINSYRSQIKQKDELIFADFLDSFVDDFQNKELVNSNEIRKMKKRSATIVKLWNNPDLTLDVPKTLENIGTITRNAFEDKRAPMYHVRNLMGSTKNAVLSAMRIPPQNLMIPSNYQIENIKPEEISDGSMEVLGGINRKMLSRSNFGDDAKTEDSERNNAIQSDPFGIVETFARVGSAIRDSVRSGQNTLSHIGDIAHNARKIYHTTKNTVPRVFIPYAKAPVLMRSRFKDNNNLPSLKKAVIITPKVMAFKDPLLGSQSPEPDYVKMGNILDALGISKPDKDQLDMERFVIKTPKNGNVKGIYIPPIGDIKSVNGKEIPALKSVKKTLNLMDEKVSSSRAVKDALVKMKKDAANTLEKTKSKVEQVKDNIANTLQYHKRKNDVLTNMLLKNTFKSNGGLESNILDNSASRVRNFTKKEEKEIIDTFLDNIFKMDKKHEKEKQNKKHSKDLSLKKSKNLKYLKKNPNSEININSSPHTRTEDEINELMRNLTMGIPIDEIENVEKTKISSNAIRKKTHKKKIHKNVIPDVELKSRFMGNDIEKQEPRKHFPENSEELGESDEDIRKVDEYVVDHIVSTKNDENVQHFIDDPSEETSDNSNQLFQSHENNDAPYSPRTSSWVPEDSNNENTELRKLNEISETKDARKIDKRSLDDQVVGLNLPPELLKPFMARAPDEEVEKIFQNGEHKEEIVGSAQPEPLDNTYKVENVGGSSFSSISPSDLIGQMRSRPVNIDRNRAVYRASQNPNVYFSEREQDETNFGQQDDINSLENNMRYTGNSEYTLCSPSFTDGNSPILCGNGYENKVEQKSGGEEESGVGQSRTSMVFGDNLKKPFMGLENKDATKKFYEEYNGDNFMDHPYDSEERFLFSDHY